MTHYRRSQRSNYCTLRQYSGIFEGREINHKMSCYKNHSSDHDWSTCVLYMYTCVHVYYTILYTTQLSKLSKYKCGYISTSTLFQNLSSPKRHVNQGNNLSVLRSIKLAAMAWKDKIFMHNFGGRFFLEDCDVDFTDCKK